MNKIITISFNIKFKLSSAHDLSYGMSMIKNLDNIKEKGIRQFVKEEKEKWKCQDCGSILCVHRDFCLNCEAKR